jgi:hypothetical protein
MPRIHGGLIPIVTSINSCVEVFPTRLAVLLTMLGCIASNDSSAAKVGSVVRISDELTCARCRILLDTVAILEVPPDTVDGFPASVRVDRTGRFWVFRQGEFPAVFDSTGRFTKTFGEKGDGPGEYRWPYDLIAVSLDTVLILDRRANRITYLDASLKAVHHTSTPFQLFDPILISWPSNVMATGAVAYRESEGQLLQISLASGQAELVGVHQMRVQDADSLASLTLHRLTAFRENRFWGAWLWMYDLSEFDSTGTRLRTFERRPEWFAKMSPFNYNWKNEPPPPNVKAIQLDDSGLLWVFIHVPSSRWREAWPKVPDNVGEVPVAKIKANLLHSTIVEVIDTEKERVVARASLGSFTISALPNGQVAFYEEDDFGARTILATPVLRR